MRVAQEYRKLFEPGTIGNVQLKNRLIMAPMGIRGLVEVDGSLSQRAIDYYEERARGGVGLIVTGIAFACTKFDPYWIEGKYFPFHRIDSPMVLPRLNQLAERLHDYDCKLCIQMSPGHGRVARLGWMQSGQPISASALSCYWEPSLTTRALTTKETEELVSSFGPAARFAQIAGVDAIQLHCHEGYLADQFMTSLWNKRTDKYGGATVRERMTFVLEIIEQIQHSIQTAIPIVFRMALTHRLPGGRTEEEGLEICQILEEAGVAAIEVDSGAYENWYWPHPPVYQPPACNLDMAAKAKKVVKRIPVICVGKMCYPDIAAKAVEEGKADFVAIGRGLLADPEWPNKTRGGRVQEIRPCIGCQECQGRARRLSITCALNPACGDEKALRLMPAEKKKRVLVIGGGPAGMEAARVARLRGHQVTLYEKSGQLGGDLIPASVPDFKQDLRLLREWYAREMRRLGVSVHLNTEATLQSSIEDKPDVVFLAVGAAPKIPQIPGVDSAKVATAVDVLNGKADVGRSVLIVGGGVIGCELAVHLAKKGKKASIIEVLPQVLNDIVHIHAGREMLLKMLEDNKVHIYTNTTVDSIAESGVTVIDKDFRKRDIKTDSVVIAIGFTSHGDDLWKGLSESSIEEAYRIGSCANPGRIIDAVWQAYGKARLI